MLLDAIQWIRDRTLNASSLPSGTRRPEASPAATAAAIPPLLAAGERDLATRYARWLVTVQQPDGSFGESFDTGEAVRGWIGILELLPELEAPLRRACNALLRAADPDTARLPVPARGGPWSLGWRGEVCEAVQLRSLAPVRMTGHALGERSYADFVDRSRDYYLRNLPLADFAQRNALTHWFALVQAALVELNCHEVARRGMAAVAAIQQDNGAVPAYADVAWVCSSGLAQLASVWYALGETGRADRAVAFLERLQNPSGGFFGSYGVSADWHPAEEIAAAAVAAADAGQRRIAAHLPSPARSRTMARAQFADAGLLAPAARSL